MTEKPQIHMPLCPDDEVGFAVWRSELRHKIADALGIRYGEVDMDNIQIVDIRIGESEPVKKFTVDC